MNARDLAPAETWRRMTAVFQDFMSYDLIVAENVAVGDIERRADRAALRKALLGGYDTLLSKTFMADVRTPT